MNNLNSILIEGNLVKDPLIKATPKGTQVCTMRFASNRYYKLNNQDPDFFNEVSYFNVETWAKLAEACYNKGRKGRGIRVVGRLKQERWNDPEGKPQSRVTIVAEHVEFRPEYNKDSGAVPIGSENPDIDDDDSTGMSVSEMNAREVEPVVF